MLEDSITGTSSVATLIGAIIGLDVSDKYTDFYMLDAESGDTLEEGRFRTTPEDARNWLLGKAVSSSPSIVTRVVLEAGVHSPWLSRLAAECGHDVLVANPRKLRLIAESDTKTDRRDAEMLARVARMDSRLLSPVVHRSLSAQAALARLRSRDALVRTRTQLINHVRGSIKSIGGRIPKCATTSFTRIVSGKASVAGPLRNRKKKPQGPVEGLIPEELRASIEPIVAVIDELTQKIRFYDRELERIAEQYYPETGRLRQVPGVGVLTALCFVLTLEDPGRFKTSRAVGAYLGLRPRLRMSGGNGPQLRITKAGDLMLRRLLVGCGQYILGPFGKDTDLRRWGLSLAARGGKNAKKRAVVAVARKLAVLLHRLWMSGEVYVPNRNNNMKEIHAA